MRYLSVCSGIEAASVAWESLGWKAVGFSEIDPFPSAVLKHRYPEVVNYGDMSKFREWGIERGSVDVLVGGTPCQSFSVAGLRAGLADPRGNLALTYLSMVDYFRPRWVVWENVPGVLSSNGGRDFGTFIGAFSEIGYSFAWRILDARFFGVPQRRRRVFIVGHFRDWRNPAKVLFEPEGVRGNSSPGRKAGEDDTGSTGEGLARCITTGEAKRQDWESCTLIAATQYGGVAGTLTARHDSSPCADRGMNINAFDETQITCPTNKSRCLPGSPSPTLAKQARPPTIAINSRQDPDSWIDRTGPLDTDGGTMAILLQKKVRRLTPRECERLQGFPDDWTVVPYRGKPAVDGPRYKAIGNSMAVPVMRWIGERIQKVDGQTK